MRKNTAHFAVLWLAFGLISCPLFGAISPVPRSVLVLDGPEETVIGLGQFGQWNIPDGTISYQNKNGNLHLWLSGLGGAGYRFISSSLDNLVPNPSQSGNAIPVISPNPNEPFEQDYAAPGAVLAAKTGNDLLMIYHAENHKCRNAQGQQIPLKDKSYNSIAIARSVDDGITWTRQGRIITSAESDPYSNCPTVVNPSLLFQGAGQPASIRSNDGKWIYTYFSEWRTTNEPGLLLARASIDSDGSPGSWQKYDPSTAQFSGAGLGGTGSSVIKNSDTEYGRFAAMASVSFNTYLNRYIAVFMGHLGFYYSTSLDGITWESSHLLWSIQGLTTYGSLSENAYWYYYPSLLSPNSASHETTGTTAWLYYARGQKLTNPNPGNAGAHIMLRRAVRIGKDGIDFPIPDSRPTVKNLVQGTTTSLSNSWTWVCRGDISSVKTNGEHVVLYDDQADTGLISVWSRGTTAQVSSDYGGECSAVSESEKTQAVRDAEHVLTKISGCMNTCNKVIIKEIGVNGDVQFTYENYLKLPN
jgi:hypothetical protein